jgi:hypothetical protein
VEASLSHRDFHIADLARWLTTELGDPADATAFARFVQDDVLTWRAPAANVASFRTLIAFTFGNRMEPNGNRSPGPVNDAIAAVAAEVQRGSGAVVYAQWEVAEPLAALLPGAPVIPIHPDRDARAEPVYLGTLMAIRRVVGLCGGAAALGTVGIIAFRDHLRRCVATARALGLDAHAPEGITMPNRYDPLSGQPWCRNRLAYLLHDIAVGAAERRDAACAEAGLTS